MRSTVSLGIPFLLMASALSGCSVAPRDSRAVYEPVTDATSSAAPMARLSPSAGDVVAVLESRVGGVLTQRVVLKGDPQTPGENAVTIKVDQGSRGIADVRGEVPKPTESMIESELSDGFGDIDMRMSLAWNRNSFGPFGYAIGHAGQNVTCVYAWQYSAGRAPRLVDTPGAFTSGGSMPSAPTSVRARLCKAGLGEAEIVAILRDMTIYAPGSNAPYVDPAFEGVGASGAHDALSSAGVPGGYFLAPKSATTQADAESPPRAAHASRHHRRVVAHERHRRVRVIQYDPAPAAQDSAPTRVVNVPLPGGAAASAATAPAAAPASNPLLAPLQGAAAMRASANDEMPLPPRAPAAARATPPAAPAESKPLAAPVPLPN